MYSDGQGMAGCGGKDASKFEIVKSISAFLILKSVSKSIFGGAGGEKAAAGGDGADVEEDFSDTLAETCVGRYSKITGNFGINL